MGPLRHKVSLNRYVVANRCRNPAGSPCNMFLARAMFPDMMPTHAGTFDVFDSVENATPRLSCTYSVLFSTVQ